MINTDTPLFEMTMLELASPTGPNLTIQQRFEEFDRLNPWVLGALEQLTQIYLSRGHKRIGIKMLFEVLRWQYGITVGDEFRLNNNFTSRYVRLLILKHPEWETVFALRHLRAM